MLFQGAVIREQGQTFAVVVVQRHVIDNRPRPPTRSQASAPCFWDYRSC